MINISLVGCEGAGKTTLIKKVSKYFDEFFSIEFGKWYCINKLKDGYIKNNKILTTKKDFENIVEGQKEIDKKIKKKTKIFFLKDTDFIFTKYFYIKQFNDSEWLDEEINNQNIDLYIFLKNKNIFYRKNTIININNKEEETKKLLKMYKSFYSDKLLIIEYLNKESAFNKIINVLNKLWKK